MNFFARSIGAITKLIAADQSADLVALYEYRAEEGNLRTWKPSHHRVALPASAATWLSTIDTPVIVTGTTRPLEISRALLQGFSTCLLAPLAYETRGNIFLYAGWRTMQRGPNVSSIADLIDSLRLIVERADQEQYVQSLLRDLLRLQSELADGKIAERVESLIHGGVAERGASEVIRRHIRRVLESGEHAAVLTKRVELLKMELAARKRIALAKAIVQKKDGVSEQEAHLHLQRASRRTRRSIAEIAEEVLTGNPKTAQVGK